MIDNIATTISQHNKILVVTHVNPDGDAIGSLLGMFLALKDLGKTTAPALGEDFPDAFAFLPGKMDAVVGIDKLPFDPTCVIAVDVATKERIAPSLDSIERNFCLINIDHHPTNTRYGDLNYVRADANSSTQLVYELLCRMGYSLSLEVAKCLYTGLVTDTGCFKFSGVTSKTFSLAAKLLEPGLDSYDITNNLFEQLPVSRLTLERLILERLEFLLDGNLVMSYLDVEDYKRIGASLADGESVVNRLRETRGVEVGALITSLGENSCKASLRSKGRIDVSKVASDLGGGGHSRAAGIKSSIGCGALREKLIDLVRQSLETNST